MTIKVIETWEIWTFNGDLDEDDLAEEGFWELYDDSDSLQTIRQWTQNTHFQRHHGVNYKIYYKKSFLEEIPHD
jgi:hypothetical protein